MLLLQNALVVVSCLQITNQDDTVMLVSAHQIYLILLELKCPTQSMSLCHNPIVVFLRWYGHVLRKEDNDWVKKCMEYEVEGARPRDRPKKTRTEIVEKDCKARGLNREDAVDSSRWRKQIGMIDDHDECVWVNVSSGTGSPGQPKEP